MVQCYIEGKKEADEFFKTLIFNYFIYILYIYNFFYFSNFTSELF